MNNMICPDLQLRGGWWEGILADRCTFPIEPRNTYSNIAYIIAAALCLLLRPTLPAIAFTSALIFLGIGSFLYHGTKKVWAQKLDDSGMYAVFVSLVIYALAPFSNLTPWLMILVSAIVIWRLIYNSNNLIQNSLLGTFVACVVLYLILHHIWINALVGLLFFGLAYIVWWMDRKKTFWFPLWGHAVWHVLTAVATLILFLGIA